MIKIWKYSIPGHCEGHIRQVLNVKIQYGKPVVWVVLDDEMPYRALDFYTIGTGWELVGKDEEVMMNSAYIGTVKDEEGYIWHCFCVATQPDNPPVEENGEEKTEKGRESAAAGSTDVETGEDDRVNG